MAKKKKAQAPRSVSVRQAPQAEKATQAAPTAPALKTTKERDGRTIVHLWAYPGRHDELVNVLHLLQSKFTVSDVIESKRGGIVLRARIFSPKK